MQDDRVETEWRFHHQAMVELKILDIVKRKDPENLHNVIHMNEYFYFRNHLCISFELLGLPSPYPLVTARPPIPRGPVYCPTLPRAPGPGGACLSVAVANGRAPCVCDRVNLYELIKKNNFQGFSVALIRRFAHALLRCLQMLHAENIIHCDLKPENILLSQKGPGNIKVVDFGSSCYEQQRVYTYIQSRFYRSPEVILGQPYSMAIDMWSLGCILAELYTGYPLFPGESEAEQMACIMEVMGVPPGDFIQTASRRRLFFDSKGNPRNHTNSKGKKRKPSSRDLSTVLKTNDLLFLDFIKRCLDWDPATRMTPDEGVQHPWIMEGNFNRVRRPAPQTNTQSPAPQKTTQSSAPQKTTQSSAPSQEHKETISRPPTDRVTTESVGTDPSRRGSSGSQGSQGSLGSLVSLGSSRERLRPLGASSDEDVDEGGARVSTETEEQEGGGGGKWPVHIAVHSQQEGGGARDTSRGLPPIV
ncbi:hypothetical protein CRUP_032225 [Coryphaenoides rupestris]|nr:hypothetical protein CRUP_032225 [Coryphaenoides rupestris]